MEEPALPRTLRGANLDAALKEDLDLHSVQELGERIARLETEIARTRQAMERKQSGRSAAAALFSLQR